LEEILKITDSEDAKTTALENCKANDLCKALVDCRND